MKSPGRSVFAERHNNAAERGTRPVHSHKHRICHPVLSFYALFNPIPPDRGGPATDRRRPTLPFAPSDCSPPNGQLPPVHPMQKSLARVIVPSAGRVKLEFWGHSTAGFSLVRVNYVSPNIFSLFFFCLSRIRLWQFSQSRTKWTRFVYRTIDSRVSFGWPTGIA